MLGFYCHIFHVDFSSKRCQKSEKTAAITVVCELRPRRPHPALVRPVKNLIKEFLKTSPRKGAGGGSVTRDESLRLSKFNQKHLVTGKKSGTEVKTQNHQINVVIEFKV